jgi:hypothetical protein
VCISTYPSVFVMLPILHRETEYLTVRLSVEPAHRNGTDPTFKYCRTSDRFWGSTSELGTTHPKPTSRRTSEKSTVPAKSTPTDIPIVHTPRLPLITSSLTVNNIYSKDGRLLYIVTVSLAKSKVKVIIGLWKRQVCLLGSS